MMKNFDDELSRFVKMIREGNHFALGRFCDGEGCIILNMDEKHGGWLRRKRLTATWEHVPGDSAHESFRKRLIDALSYSAPRYYVGIPCSSDHAPQYSHFFRELKAMTRVPEDQLTFGRIFHYHNYPAFLDEFLPAVMERNVFLICNERADSTAIRNVSCRWNVAAVNASLNSLGVIEDIKDFIRKGQLEGGVFLISTGPSGAVFAHELWKFNQDNTYVDIGSSLDPIYFRASPCQGITRVYLRHFVKGKKAKPFVWG